MMVMFYSYVKLPEGILKNPNIFWRFVHLYSLKRLEGLKELKGWRAEMDEWKCAKLVADSLKPVASYQSKSPIIKDLGAPLSRGQTL